jgi:N-acetylglucosaminyldiphosphoundecaprenol N-acetyl-beta-D-mannosaminyltransferase
MSTTGKGQHDTSRARQPCWIFDIPLMPLTLDEAAVEVERLILRGTPSYLITANLNYAMLVSQHPDLHEVNRNAALIVADGMPLVWTSRMTQRPLPERVTGTDLLYRVSELAAHKGYSSFLLGAAPGVAERAARNLCGLSPGLRIVGTESPAFRDLSPDEHARLIARIHSVRPDVLFIAMSQPQGERWMFRNYKALGVPVSIQVGSAVDFAAGLVPRAPRWMRALGLEAPYRMYKEPLRLTPRYGRNALFLAKSLVRFALSPEWRRQDRSFDPMTENHDS